MYEAVTVKHTTTDREHMWRNTQEGSTRAGLDNETSRQIQFMVRSVVACRRLLDNKHAPTLRNPSLPREQYAIIDQWRRLIKSASTPNSNSPFPSALEC